MFEEFAVDPSLIAQWEYFKELRDKFGIDKGRLIADFPLKGWKKQVAKLLAVNQQNARPLRNCSTIEAWLRAPDGKVDSRFAKSKRAYDESKRWALNAVDHAQTFHAVLSEEALEASNAIQVTETLCLSEHPRFQIETQPRVRRTNEDLINIAKPLLRASSQIKWIDRFFDPSDNTKIGPLKHMINWMHDQLPQLREIELHVERSDHFGQNTKSHYASELGKILPTGFTVRVFFWSAGTENLHPRFLLTDVAGLQYDYGLDRGQLQTETTIVILTTPTRRMDEWKRYSVDSEDLDLDPNEHVLLLGR